MKKHKSISLGLVSLLVLGLCCFSISSSFAQGFSEPVYQDTTWEYSASAFMGENNGSSLVFSANSTEVPPAQGENCTRVSYEKSVESWAGVCCLYSGKWGSDPASYGMNLTGYTKLTWQARAAVDNTVVEFGMGSGDAHDTAGSNQAKYTLTTEWQTFEMNLGGKDMSDINTLFKFVTSESDNHDLASPVVFYIDDVKYVNPSGAEAVITVNAVEGAISVSITGSYDFSDLNFGESSISDSALVVTNTGNTAETFYLSVADPGEWTSGTTQGNNVYVLNSKLNSSQPSEGSFEPANHALSETPQRCSSTRFAGDQTGVGVAKDDTRNMWLELNMPTGGEAGGHQIRLIVTAEAE